MAIYHLNISHVSKGSQAKAFTSVAHVAYQMREDRYERDDVLHKEAMLNGQPVNGQEYRQWLKDYEINSRSNARIIDKMTVALPKEFEASHQIEVTRKFIQEVSKERLSNYAFALHKDEGNPHAHIAFVNLDKETGKRIRELHADKNYDRIREQWSKTVNDYAKERSINIQIDHRSLQEQGLEREPGKHIGWVGESRIQIERAKATQELDKVKLEIKHEQQELDRGLTPRDPATDRAIAGPPGLGRERAEKRRAEREQGSPARVPGANQSPAGVVAEQRTIAAGASQGRGESRRIDSQVREYAGRLGGEVRETARAIGRPGATEYLGRVRGAAGGDDSRSDFSRLVGEIRASRNSELVQNLGKSQIIAEMKRHLPQAWRPLLDLPKVEKMAQNAFKTSLERVFLPQQVQEGVALLHLAKDAAQVLQGNLAPLIPKLMQAQQEQKRKSPEQSR